MIKETELKYTVNTLVELSRKLWGDNSTEFLAGALESVITDKQMKALIGNLEKQMTEFVFFGGDTKENTAKVSRYKGWCGALGLDADDDENWISFCEGEQE